MDEKFKQKCKEKYIKSKEEMIKVNREKKWIDAGYIKTILHGTQVFVKDGVQLNPEKEIKPQLQLYVWEGVLGDSRGDGIAFAYARSKDDALETFKRKDEIVWKILKDIEPRIVNNCEVFYVWAGE